MVLDRQIKAFSLVIGIDEYQSPEVPRLRRCASDADIIYDYILDTFGPENAGNILILKNGNATRRAILSAFRSHLIDNEDIKAEDSVIVYFAGHGIRTAPPTDWVTGDRKIEALCPSDEGILDPETGEVVRCIPDITIHKLLQQVSLKNQNITVIFDCCHSGGGTRDIFDDHYAIFRSRDLEPKLDEAPFPPIDRDIWSLPDPPQLKKTQDFLLDTLFAACRPLEKAKDGYFTHHLIMDILRPRDKRGVATTLSDLEVLVSPLTGQNPVFRGPPNKLLFRNSSIDVTRKSFSVRKLSDGSIRVEAGRIHGIGVGDIFKLPDGRTLKVETSNIFASTLKDTLGSTTQIPDGTKVIATPSLVDAKVSAFLSDELKNSIPPRSSTLSFEAVADYEEATVAISRGQDDTVEVELRDALFQGICSRTSFDWSHFKDNIPGLLESIAVFRLQLARQSVTSDLALLTQDQREMAEPRHLWSDVNVSLYRIEKRLFFYTPKEPVSNLFQQNVAHLKHPEGSEYEYGICIQNKGKMTLFFYVFYCNPADFSIDDWNPVKHLEVPPGQRATIGYGSAGGQPFTFDLDKPENMKSESGFLKIFAASQPVNGMESFVVPAVGASSEEFRRIRQVDVAKKDEWGTWTGIITVTPT
ncbi:hypothetical protein FA15DRAFT_616471 [Coprinopsis marcescibilis]|uniref:Peptidase C14 caspase domain-containing protein n=1 Tax=Coprinopsis marcescibilis TaxID=230819 RepID=A0A5C3KZJ9_COPMA|nr:hypothetical protein FA15DRAFT_616471 [Coprinopsis marcescibilis]